MSNIKFTILYKVGRICHNARKRKKKYQIEVALDTKYSVENISAFENGRNDNVIIFAWYIKNCLDVEDIDRCYKILNEGE